ncbi:hypothetical protein GA0070616_1236 [Micromonospora nigra]|uniref:Uncharacterized protein n=1 Tax=Micromonospora nigra TaxID=145857 RepID=A0A1C6RJA6_9ACTN|nr:hypothetical protein [Micromonospora nigra]SCL17254.1 hypothetical protein GA0070616_1236 [Micromonospora nigra]
MPSSEPDRRASRRGLLRRAAVTGGAAVAATTAASALDAAPAAAATDGAVALGLPNQATTWTQLTAAVEGGATLALKNPTGAPLHLGRRPSYVGWGGSVVSTPAGLGVHRVVDGTVERHEVHTTANSTMLVPIRPTRILDTRSSAGRARLIEGQFDAQGRAVAGTYLLVHLDGIVDGGDGMLGNITVAKTTKGGFATVYGRGNRPTASTINWWAADQVLANAFITQIDPWQNTVGVYVQATTAVILDVTGLLVYAPESVVINNPHGAGRAAAADPQTRAVRTREVKATAQRIAAKEQAGE